MPTFFRRLALLLLGIALPLGALAFAGSGLSIGFGADTVDLPTLGYVSDADTMSNDDFIRFVSGTDGIIYRVIRLIKYFLMGILMVMFGVYVTQLIIGRGDSGSLDAFKTKAMNLSIGFVLVLLAEPLAFAFQMGGDAAGGNFITDPELLKKSVNIAAFSVRAAITLMEYLLGFIALFFMGLSAFRIVTSSGDEGKVTESRKELVWATVGLIVVASAHIITDYVLAPRATNVSATEVVVNLEHKCFAASGASRECTPAELKTHVLKTARIASRATVINYVKYFQTFIATLAVAMVFLAGIRMVTAAGDEGIIDQQKKNLLWVMLGLGIVLFAEVFVNIFFPQKGDQIGVPGEDQIGTFAMQMGGFSNFLLSFMGAVAVLSLIVGALMYAGAGLDESKSEEAKKIILGSALGIILTISAYALVNTIFTGTAVGPTPGPGLGVTLTQ